MAFQGKCQDHSKRAQSKGDMANFSTISSQHQNYFVAQYQIDIRMEQLGEFKIVQQAMTKIERPEYSNEPMDSSMRHEENSLSIMPFLNQYTIPMGPESSMPVPPRLFKA